MADIICRRRVTIYDYSGYDTTLIPLVGERRYFDTILTGITQPCSVFGDGVNKVEDLPFLELIDIESNANISLEILRINRNKVIVKNIGGGGIVVNLGTVGVPVNFTLQAAGIKVWKFNGSDWEEYPSEFSTLTDVEITNDLTVGNDVDITNDLTVGGIITGEILNHDSGWLLNEMGGPGVGDWTNVHLGDDPTDPTDNLTHNLNAKLSELIVKVLISSDGTDANSLEIIYAVFEGGTERRLGITIYQIDANNIKVQTGVLGFRYNDDAGVGQLMDDEDWYYKIKIWKLG